MDFDKRKIAPYRTQAALPVIQRVDVANCFWCVWRNDPEKWIDSDTGKSPDALGWCSHPSHFMNTNGHGKSGRCSGWNRDGDCPVYQPTLWTRILIWFGIRKMPFRFVEE